MKTKELIRQLQEADPEGNCEVFSNGDIFFVQRLPWFYDGKPGILIRDESKQGSYNIKGMRQITAADGPDKLYIMSMGLEDLAMDADEMGGFVIEGSDDFKKSYQKYYEDYRNLDKVSE